MPLISFCLSTYKRGSTLKSTLESIVRQNFHDYEVIVSDNDVEESGSDIVASINDPRFKYFANKKNLGMKASFNKSLQRSSGEYIVMMADDDPVYFDMLSTLVDLLHTYPGYGMYMGGCDWFCTDNEIGKLYKLNVGSNSCLSNEHNLNFVRAYSADEFIKQFFLVKILKHHLWSTCMVKKEVLISKGGVPEYGTPFLGDYAYLAIAASHSGCVVINKPLGCQTLHSENFGRNQHDELISLVQNFPAYVGERLKHLPSWPIIEKHMLNYLALWEVSHLAFLYAYFKKSGKNQLSVDFRKVETDLFNIDLMKKYKLRYLLRTRAPLIFNQLSFLKNTLIRKHSS